MESASDRPSIAPAGIVLGIGLGGFIDGIVFHQILQLHNMISAKVPPDTMQNMSQGMVADGWFHIGTWLATVIGVALLWRALNRRQTMLPSGAAFIGYLLAGWGWFNLVEGLIDHHLLGLHHVVERLGLSMFDWLYLASGVVLIVLGHVMGRRGAT
ncbi:MAG: DUF2243 domain-containing protein [Erythrobacter sp.]|nr:MAG: DUF2243 domain-containing protein [Erythrobacter sp.]